MNEDKNLEKVSFKFWIISIVILCIVVILQLVFQSVLIVNIIATIFIAISSGIFGSAFVLWFSKKYDIRKIKRELKNEYFNIARDLNYIIYKIQPILKGNQKDLLSYSEFYDNSYLWNELQKKFNQLVEICDENDDMEIINNINTLFEDIIAKIRYNATMIRLIGEDVKNNDAFLINEEKIFTIEREGKYKKYWSPSKKITDKIIELEKKVLNKETIKPIVIPNAVIIVD